jgi:hypothetical protein
LLNPGTFPARRDNDERGVGGRLMTTSLIKATWASLEMDQEGYGHVLNVETDVVLGPDEPGYDEEKVNALVEEIIPLMAHYDRANVVNAKSGERSANQS